MKKSKAGEGAPPASISKLRSRSMTRMMAVLVLVTAIAALLQRGGAVEWLFAAAAMLTVGGGLLLPYMAIGRIHAERTVYNLDGLIDGGEMRVALTLQLSRMLPFMWVCLQEEIVNACAPQGGITVIRALLPGLERELSLRYKVSGLQRGELHFQRTTLSVGDMLGLTVRTLVIDCPGGAIVKPAAPPDEPLGALPGFEAERARRGMQPVSTFGGQMMSAASRLRRAGAGPELRGYVPGDSLRRVDWRGMARGLGMQTRMDEAEEAGTVVILLETSAAAYGNNGRLFDANAGRALAFKRQAEREGKHVQLLTNALAESVIYDSIVGGSKSGEAETRIAKLRLHKAFKPMSQRLSDVVAGAPRGAAVLCLTAGSTGSAEAIARQSGDPGNISYGAKLAGVRGVRLLLLLSLPASGSDGLEKRWQERLQGTGCLVKALPMPESYGRVKPNAEEVAIRAGKERRGEYAQTANR